MQGSYLIEKPHYVKREQLMCLIDGQMDIKMVPHFNRQEVYAGRDILTSPYNEQYEGIESEFKDRVNTSPINFFSPKKVKYPNFERAIYQTEKLEAGDCIFIPAYYFYHFQAYNLPVRLRRKDITWNFEKPEQWQTPADPNAQTAATIVSL